MMNQRTALTGSLTIFIVIAAAYLLQLSDLTRPILTNSIFLLPPALAVAGGFYALSVYHISSKHGRVIAYLTAGLSCWFIGELIFYTYQFILHDSPFPSLADVFYLAAYPLLLIGLVKEIKTHGRDWRVLRGADKLVFILSGFLVLALAFIVGYFGVFQAYEPDAPMLNNIIAIGYGVADLILLVPVLFILRMALNFRGGKLLYSWLLILAALICIMTGDILFAMFTDQYEDLDPAYTLIDLAWVAGYLLFAYSFIYTAAIVKDLRSTLVQKSKE